MNKTWSEWANPRVLFCEVSSRCLCRDSERFISVCKDLQEHGRHPKSLQGSLRHRRCVPRCVARFESTSSERGTQFSNAHRVFRPGGFLQRRRQLGGEVRGQKTNTSVIFLRSAGQPNTAFSDSEPQCCKFSFVLWNRDEVYAIYSIFVMDSITLACSGHLSLRCGRKVQNPNVSRIEACSARPRRQIRKR